MLLLPLLLVGQAERHMFNSVVTFVPSLSYFPAVSYLQSQTEDYPPYCYFFSFPTPSTAARPNCSCLLPSVWSACLHQDGSSGEEMMKRKGGLYVGARLHRWELLPTWRIHEHASVSNLQLSKCTGGETLKSIFSSCRHHFQTTLFWGKYLE